MLQSSIGKTASANGRSQSTTFSSHPIGCVENISNSKQEDLSPKNPSAKFQCRTIDKTKNQKTLDLLLTPQCKSTYTTAIGTQYSTVNFSINGENFTRISGNERDEKISGVIKDLHEYSINILVTYDTVRTCRHIPDPLFQKNFIRCINEGMSFYRISMDPERIEPITGKTYREVLGDDFNKTTCRQFAEYLKYNIDNQDELERTVHRWILIDDIHNSPEFSHIRIEINGTPIHWFIHIAHGICLQKTGSFYIEFINFDQVLECYGLSSNSGSYTLKMSQQDLCLSDSKLSVIEG